MDIITVIFWQSLEKFSADRKSSLTHARTRTRHRILYKHNGLLRFWSFDSRPYALLYEYTYMYSARGRPYNIIAVSAVWARVALLVGRTRKTQHHASRNAYGLPPTIIYFLSVHVNVIHGYVYVGIRI